MMLGLEMTLTMSFWARALSTARTSPARLVMV
jgi:hypothetical protein